MCAAATRQQHRVQGLPGSCATRRCCADACRWGGQAVQNGFDRLPRLGGHGHAARSRQARVRVAAQVPAASRPLPAAAHAHTPVVRPPGGVSPARRPPHRRRVARRVWGECRTLILAPPDGLGGASVQQDGRLHVVMQPAARGVAVVMVGAGGRRDLGILDEGSGCRGPATSVRRSRCFNATQGTTTTTTTERRAKAAAVDGKRGG